MNARLMSLLLVIAAPGFLTGADLAFHKDGEGFVFDTGVVRGKLRAGGKSRGLSSVVHLPTGTVLDRGTGLAGHYRVFSANHRYSTAAWDWPSQADLTGDGRVEVRWLAAPDRPFELRTTYAWIRPDLLEVVTSVQAETNLTNFESFLASYFAPAFTNSLVWVSRLPVNRGKGFMPAEKSNGVWQIFPRDAAAMDIVKDGRWTIPPSPVAWERMPGFAAPVGIRRAPDAGLGVVLMSTPEDCFAVLTPEQTEGHYSMYLSLFGRDLKKGESARARARLWITESSADSAVAGEYERFKNSRR